MSVNRKPRPRKLNVPLIDHDRREEGILYWDFSSGYTISRNPKEKYVEMWQGDSLVASLTLSEATSIGKRLYSDDNSDDDARLRARALCSAAVF